MYAGSVFFNITNASGFQNASLTASNPTGGVYNATIDTSGFLDGIYNITVWARDSLNNTNNSALVNSIIIDNTAPTISLTCDVYTISMGQTLSCSCSPTDNIIGVNTSATSHTAHPVTTATGITATSCTAVDLINNSRIAYINYTVTAIDTEGNIGSGGSGGTSTPANKVANSWDIPAGGSVTMKTFDAEYGLKQITITVNAQTNDVKLTVSKYNTVPQEVGVSKAGEVYKYLQIKVDNVNTSLKDAQISIQVEKGWVDSRKLTKSDIAMFRFDGTEWKEITTTYTGEDVNNYYYNVNVNSFSYFSIGQKSSSIVSDTTQTVGGDNGTNTSTTSGNWIIIIVVALIIIIVAVVLAIMYSRKNKRKFR
jgi:PGF-pre-PGF domain-containing protein